MSILKELNELAAKYSQDYEKEATIEGAIDAVDKSLEGALGSLGGDIEDLQDLAYGENGTPAEPAEGSILDRIGDLEALPSILIANATQLPPETPADPEDEAVDPGFVLNKTWQEIHDATFAIVVLEVSNENETGSFYSRGISAVDNVKADVDLVTPSNTVYSVSASGRQFNTSSPSGYPESSGDDK